MGFSRTQHFPWRSPLDIAAQVAAAPGDFVFLYSSLETGYSGRHSWLAFDPKESVTEGFSALQKRLDAAGPGEMWFGHAGYEALSQPSAGSFIETPPFRFTRFGALCRFDHQARRFECEYSPDTVLPDWTSLPETTPVMPPSIREIICSLPKTEYFDRAQATLEAIRAGAFYQANLTRKFFGHFVEAPDPFALFARLSSLNPAPYGALLRLGKQWILSSSPERFLKVDPDGWMEARPIKGTRARASAGEGAEEEAIARAKLAGSLKDRAENLMIVDLMRNDLARSAVPGSVRAEEIFRVESYATLHHLTSVITAKKRPGLGTAQAVASAFPPGSMTGAPKKAAIDWCARNEPRARGIYSGALGWFGADGACDLSVVIRTIILEADRFEFQTGGAIVADSDPEAEWRETLTKARPLALALGIDPKVLAEL
jgi:anthranilate/para-aminobenzoate synthase component I